MKPPRVDPEPAKRVFDIVFSTAAICAMGPLLAATAAVIKLDSRGPVFYRGVRVGRNGVTFRIFKFRTMNVGAEAEGTTTKLHDSRITRVGHVLRKYKLDELPQFLNVLLGEMSVVGPRPEVEEHTSQYKDDELLILTVKPGITDFASIRYADLAAELGTEDPHRVYVTKVRAEKNQLRVEYVRRRSLWTDCKIIFGTIRAIAKKV